MRQSDERPAPAVAPEAASRRASASTAAGMSAQRVALADRDRAQRTLRARTAARQLIRRSAM